jgi:hypothetical protein
MIVTLAPQRLTDGAGGCSSCVVDQRDTPVLTAAEAAAEPSLSRPLIEDARALPDRVAPARPTPGLGLEDRVGAIDDIILGRAADLRAVL